MNDILTPEQEKELTVESKKGSIYDRVFSMNGWFRTVIGASLLVYYATSFANKLDNTNTLLLSIKEKQEKDSQDTKQEQTIMKADISMLKVDMAINKSKLEDLENKSASKY